MKNKLIVEEKIDGANLGISFDQDGTLILQNRGAVLSPPYTGQWQKLKRWLSIHMEKLFDHLHDRYILFGEWCFAKHSIGYNKLPDYFLGFDVFDKKNDKFLSFDLRNGIFQQMNISRVPFLKKGTFSLSQLESMIGPSYLGNESSEGIYLRHDEGNRLVQRAKIVKAGFIQTIDTHWSREPITPNRLMDGSYL
nr:RNA ligase family protein [uncultured Desulfobacter sp.]